MEVQELLTRAWSAVEKSGIPPELQELALKEAIDYLRSGPAVPDRGKADNAALPDTRPKETPAKRTRPPNDAVDEGTFFVSSPRSRECLNVTSETSSNSLRTERFT